MLLARSWGMVGAMRRGAGVASMLVLAGCGLTLPFDRSSRSDPAPPPVGLVAEGPAFRESSAVDSLRRALERVIGRPVVVLDIPSSTAEEDLRRVAVRPMGERGAIAESRERACGGGGAVAAGIAAGVAGVYSVSLDDVQVTRALSDAERAARSYADVVLGVLRLAEPEVAREETLSGSVRWIPFSAGRGGTADLSRVATRIAPNRFGATLDLAAIVAETARGLPAPEEPNWAAFGSRLARSGCPLMALWVAETRLERPGDVTRLKAQALAALPGQVRTPGGRPSPNAPPTTAEADAGYSCRDLCGLHMVELCNGDRVLWDTNQTRWEATPCGTKRNEPFLQSCYAQQWQTGTFFNACVLPCEGTVEGRQRLIKVLESSGCINRKS